MLSCERAKCLKEVEGLPNSSTLINVMYETCIKCVKIHALENVSRDSIVQPKKLKKSKIDTPRKKIFYRLLSSTCFYIKVLYIEVEIYLAQL